jgi:hypothetical protein
MLVAFDYISIFLGVFVSLIILLLWWFLIIPLPYAKYELTEPNSRSERLKIVFYDIPLKVSKIFN